MPIEPFAIGGPSYKNEEDLAVEEGYFVKSFPNCRLEDLQSKTSSEVFSKLCPTFASRIPEGINLLCVHVYNGYAFFKRDKFGQFVYHRDNDQPAYIYFGMHGMIYAWCQNGQIHRENGPAYVYPGGFEYCRNGKYHREDGPAIKNIRGEFYYLNHKRVPDDQIKLVKSLVQFFNGLVNHEVPKEAV